MGLARFDKSGPRPPLKPRERLLCQACDAEFSQRDYAGKIRTGPRRDPQTNKDTCPACISESEFWRERAGHRFSTRGGLIATFAGVVGAAAAILALTSDDARRSLYHFGEDHWAVPGQWDDRSRARAVLDRLPDQDQDDEDFKVSRRYLREHDRTFELGSSQRAFGDLPDRRVTVRALGSSPKLYLGQPVLTYGHVVFVHVSETRQHGTVLGLTVAPPGAAMPVAICDALTVPRSVKPEQLHDRNAFIVGLVLGDERAATGPGVETTSAARMACSAIRVQPGPPASTWINPPVPMPTAEAWCDVGEPPPCSGHP